VARRPRETITYRDKEQQMANEDYPVPGRSADRNARIAAHELGHALVGRCLGTFIHLVTIVPDFSPGGYQGRTVRSGPVTALELNDDSKVMDSAEVTAICERLLELEPEIGANRIESSEAYQRCQGNIIELMGGEAGETLLHPELPVLGAVHDHTEAQAFARLAVAASPSVAALITYCKAEARGLLESNIDIARALVAALIEKGTLLTDEIDRIISATVVARSLEREHRRRDAWKLRERNAAAFFERLAD
jgi:hypothetical protein